MDASSPHTNMVYLNLGENSPLDALQVTQRMKDMGVLVDPENMRRFRLVTHYWIDDLAVEKTVSAFRNALQ